MSELRRLRGGLDQAAEEASARFERRAAQDGLVDVAYSFAESPFGPLLVAVTKRGVVTVGYPGDDFVADLQRLAWKISPRVVESRAATDDVRRQLDEYFAGRRRRFDMRPDLRLVDGFSRRVLQTTSRIPFGSTASYREVAARAGSPRGARAAGNALSSNPVPIVVPCHRVLHSGGGLGGYTGGLDRKVALLRLEGALFDAER